jgi:hypothetical protein
MPKMRCRGADSAAFALVLAGLDFFAAGIEVPPIHSIATETWQRTFTRAVNLWKQDSLACSIAADRRPA